MIYKHLLVSEITHDKVIKRKGRLTVDQFINKLMKNKMKKVIVAVAFMVAFAGFVSTTDAAVCGLQPDNSYIPCGNGNPELVVNAWGTTNSQLPHILPGQTLNGASCPVWFPMYCVDIRGTSWFQARWGR